MIIPFKEISKCCAQIPDKDDSAEGYSIDPEVVIDIFERSQRAGVCAHLKPASIFQLRQYARFFDAFETLSRLVYESITTENAKPIASKPVRPADLIDALRKGEMCDRVDILFKISEADAEHLQYLFSSLNKILSELKTAHPDNTRYPEQAAATIVLNPAEQALVNWGEKEGAITNFYQNDRYHAWGNKYHSSKSTSGKRAAFNRCANKLVTLGYFSSCVQVGLGPEGKSEFAVRTQTYWNYVRETI